MIIALILVAITLSYRNEPTKFYGIADTKETIINSEKGVEIQKLYVSQGQTVNAGDTLVVLDQPELRIRISEIMHTLNEYKAQRQYQTNFSQAEKRKYEAEQAERINEINAQIRELEAQYELNKKLVKELRSLKTEQVDEGDSTNPIITQIKGLKRQLELVSNPVQAQIAFLDSKLTDSNDPIQSQGRRYADELVLLQEQQLKLVKRAPISGMIGMVKFKEGERVSPFDTILTLHTAAPSHVKGYIHERVYSRVAAGDTVNVASFADDKAAILGVVIGVGSRIVDYPERLRSRQEIPIWGREVIIRIPDKNSLLLGEKVLISATDKKKRWVFPIIPPHTDKQ
jgi:HlyD family secretion protein